MKIISKHKDYYDWAVSIYGLDEIMVYDRRTENLEKSSKYVWDGINNPSIITHEFSICNRLYTVLQFRDNFYHTVDDILELDRILKKEKIDIYFLKNRWEWGREKKKSLRDRAELMHKQFNVGSKVNAEIREPVLIKTTYSDGSFPFTAQLEGATFFDSKKKVHSHWRIPDLSTYGFASWFPSEQMFQDVYAFISWKKDHPAIPNKQTNDEKIQSNGFDTKISFRHRK